VKDHGFAVMKSSSHYDCLIPAWDFEKHKAPGVTTSHLHCPHCNSQCDGYGKLHPECSITYEKRVSLNKDAIHIGSLIQ